MVSVMILFYGMASKGDAHLAIMSFVHDIGIPLVLISDNMEEQVHGRFCETCICYQIKQEQVVLHSPWRNLIKASFQEIKSGICKVLRRFQALKCTWCYADTWVTAI